MTTCRNREALQQELKESQETCSAQLMSARQAAVTEAVQHSTHFHAELERAAGQQKQLQQQVQELQAALANKESELGAAQMQLAAAVESCKRVQENHGKVCGWRRLCMHGSSLLLDQPVIEPPACRCACHSLLQTPQLYSTMVDIMTSTRGSNLLAVHVSIHCCLLLTCATGHRPWPLRVPWWSRCSKSLTR